MNNTHFNNGDWPNNLKYTSTQKVSDMLAMENEQRNVKLWYLAIQALIIQIHGSKNWSFKYNMLCLSNIATPLSIHRYSAGH